MADYLGTTQRLHDYFAKDWTRPDLTHLECAGMWLKVLSTIFGFPNDHPFQIKPQMEPSRPYFAPTHLSRSASANPHAAKPVWVLSDDEGTIAVVEVRSASGPADWGSIKGQAYNYIQKLKKNSAPTLGIIACGHRFICWEQMPAGGGGRFECTLPRRLFPSRGVPSSVVWDSLAVQAYFEDVKERARNGEFVDC